MKKCRKCKAPLTGRPKQTRYCPECVPGVAKKHGREWYATHLAERQAYQNNRLDAIDPSRKQRRAERAERQARFYALLAEGKTQTEAAALIGVTRQEGSRLAKKKKKHPCTGCIWLGVSKNGTLGCMVSQPGEKCEKFSTR